MAGVPGYTVVRAGLAVARKPGVDGFRSLKSADYRTVIALHEPSEDVSTAQDLAEQAGLKFTSIAVSPETLGKAFDQFRAAVDDPAKLPLVTYDNDGVLTGSLWYLYFRVVDQYGDDAARIRAQPLGLQEGTARQTKYWLAIQEYLANR